MYTFLCKNPTLLASGGQHALRCRERTGWMFSATPREAKIDRKFGLRPMKSLRKTVIVALATLLIPFISINAQETKPDTPTPTPEAQQPPSAAQHQPPPADTDGAANGQARIIRIPVNQV